jgi:hypothetical protein
MSTRNPHLLDLRPARWRSCPERRNELVSMLVNRQCMEPVLHDIAGTRIVKAVFFTFKRGEELAGETEGTNSIPYAKK